jgi:hypothetical protein
MHQKEGWIHKRAVKSGRNWRRRFFVLQGSELCYFKDESQKKKKGSMVLDAGCFVSTDSSTKMPNAFKVTWQDGTLLMLSCSSTNCDGLGQQEEWIRALQACTSNNPNKDHPNKAPHTASTSAVTTRTTHLEQTHSTIGRSRSFNQLLRTGSKAMAKVGSSSKQLMTGSKQRMTREAAHCLFAHPPWEPSARHERLVRALILLQSLATPIWALVFALLIYHHLNALGLLFMTITFVAYLPQILRRIATSGFERAMGVPISMSYLGIWVDISRRYPRLSIAVENMHVPNPAAYVNQSFVSIGNIDVVVEFNLPLLLKGVLNIVTVSVSDMRLVFEKHPTAGILNATELMSMHLGRRLKGSKASSAASGVVSGAARSAEGGGRPNLLRVRIVRCIGLKLLEADMLHVGHTLVRSGLGHTTSSDSMVRVVYMHQSDTTPTVSQTPNPVFNHDSEFVATEVASMFELKVYGTANSLGFKRNLIGKMGVPLTKLPADGSSYSQVPIAPSPGPDHCPLPPQPPAPTHNTTLPTTKRAPLHHPPRGHERAPLPTRSLKTRIRTKTGGGACHAPCAYEMLRRCVRPGGHFSLSGLTFCSRLQVLPLRDERNHVDNALGEIEVVASWIHDAHACERLDASASLSSWHCLDQVQYLDKVDGAMARIKPNLPDPIHFQCGMVTLRRIEIDPHAVIYNQTQAQINQYKAHHGGANHVHVLKIPVVDMGPDEFLPPTIDGADEWHGISKKMLKQRIKTRVKDMAKALMSAQDLARIASEIAGHKIQQQHVLPLGLPQGLPHAGLSHHGTIHGNPHGVPHGTPPAPRSTQGGGTTTGAIRQHTDS